MEKNRSCIHNLGDLWA